MSSRRNQDRISAPSPDTSPTPAATQQSDIFSYVVPTEFVDLPSEGKFYEEGHALHGKSSIEIKHMTAKEEDILTSESLLRKGLAIDRLLQSLMVDKTIKLDDLLMGDKNALIVGARITGYGAAYETSVTCPECRQRAQIEFDLDAILPRENTIPDGVYRSEENTYFIKLPQTGAEVEIQLMTGHEERLFTAAGERKRKKKVRETTTTDLLKLLIVSVNGHEDPESIKNLLDVLPVKDSVHIRNVYEQVSPDLDLNQYFECSSCEHEGSIGVPLNADFFWPNR